MPIFKSSSNKHKKKFAVIDDDNNKLKYSDLINFSEKLGKIISPRSLVFCLCKNNLESLVGYYSFLENKVVPLLLDSEISEILLTNLLKIYKPNYLWIPTKKVLDTRKRNILYNYLDYSLVAYNPKISLKLNEDLGILLTTSGSTGSKKLVRLSYKNIISNAIAISKYLSINQNDRPITTLPINYSFGMSIVNSHFVKGSTILLTNKSIFEGKFWKFLKTHKPTSLSGVPFTFEMLKKLRFFSMELPSINTITQAGGKMDLKLTKELAEYCLRTNKRLFVMYGQTEASPRISYLPHNKVLDKIGSIGIPVPGGELSLVDNEGQFISEKEIEGELVYKGTNVCLGYASKIIDLANEDENNGVLYTGDIAYKDYENFYYITGRKKRFIKLFGNRINLDDVERLIKSEICECACVGNDSIMVVYLVNENQIKYVNSFIIDNLKINSKHFKINVIKHIPKNSYGKTIYTSLKV